MDPVPIPLPLERPFRRMAEGQGGTIGGEVETCHLTRQSLAALRFVEVVGHRVRYDHGRQAWFVWQGHRWHVDRTGEIRRIWLEVLARRFKEALAIDDSWAAGPRRMFSRQL
jgi:hypothetical protein